MPYDALPGMTDVIVERTVTTALEDYDICLGDPELAGCLDLCRIEWRETFMCADGQRIICHFRAPDAESVRTLLRNTGVKCDAVWMGSMYGSMQADGGNVVVGHSFLDRIAADTAEALHAVRTQRLAPLDLELRRAIVSQDRSRILCICEAPDALTHFQDRTWRCQRVLAQT